MKMISWDWEQCIIIETSFSTICVAISFGVSIIPPMDVKMYSGDHVSSACESVVPKLRANDIVCMTLSAECNSLQAQNRSRKAQYKVNYGSSD